MKEYEDTKVCYEKEITDDQLNSWLDYKLQESLFREEMKEEDEESIRDYLEEQVEGVA